MQNVFRSLFAVSLAFALGAVAPGVRAQASFCTTGAAPGTTTPGNNGLGLFAAGQQYFASLVPGATPPACAWATPGRLRLDLPQLPGLGNARLNLDSGPVLSSITGNARRIVASTISPVICTSFLDINNPPLPGGITLNTIFALDLTNGGGMRLGDNCPQQPNPDPTARCLWGLSNFTLQYNQDPSTARSLSSGLVTNPAGLPYLQCYDATLRNSTLGSAPGGAGSVFFDDFEPPVPNVRVEFLSNAADEPVADLVHAVGGFATYRVRISNLSGSALTGVHVREFVPVAGGSISPAVVADSCEELTGSAPIACPGTRLDLQVDLAPRQSRVFRLQRRITSATAIEPAVGGLLAVAAFVHPDQGADSDSSDNVRSLRLGTTTSFIVTPVVVGNGSISPSTPQQVPPGGTFIFRLIPAANNIVQNATGCPGKLLVGPGNERFFEVSNLQASCTLTATFERVSYAVTAAPTTNGTINILTPTVPNGDTASFTVTPNTGYSTGTVTGTAACGTLVNTGGVNWSTGPITSNGCVISATFSVNQYQVTVTTSGGNGTISAVGGTPGTAPVVQTVDFGQVARVEVNPAVGHSPRFGNPSVGNCSFTPSVSSNEWTSSEITGDCAVNVSFVRNTYEVTAGLAPSSPNNSASVTPVSGLVLHGSNHFIEVRVNAGFSIVDTTGSTCPRIDPLAPGTPGDPKDPATYRIRNVEAPCQMAFNVQPDGE
jgi:hypothetical protein